MVRPSPCAPTESVELNCSPNSGLAFARISTFAPNPPHDKTTALQSKAYSSPVTTFTAFIPLIFPSESCARSVAFVLSMSVMLSMDRARVVSRVVMALPMCPEGIMERLTVWPPKNSRLCSQETPPSYVSHCAASYTPRAMTLTSSGSPRWSPPSSMSAASSSGLSSSPEFFWIQLPGTAISPPDNAVDPPNTPSFSMSSTFLLLFAALMAAVNPAPPAPTTTTSYDVGMSLSGR